MKNSAGFTLFEIVVIIGILGILLSITVPNFASMKKNQDLENASQELVSVIKLAQDKTLYSENQKSFGVYFNALLSPNQYVLFEGDNYSSRTISEDKIYSLPSQMEFYGINFGGGNEIVFEKLTGETKQAGSVAIRIKTETDRLKTIYLLSSGAVSYNPLETPLDEARVKDSRRLQFSYSRIIDTANENIVLTFEGGQILAIPISSHLISDKIQLTETMDVSGENQTIEIFTPQLNNSGSVFRILRDRRLNTKTLRITISGDSTGYLANYSADGSATNYTSAFVSEFAWQ